MDNGLSDFILSLVDDQRTVMSVAGVAFLLLAILFLRLRAKAKPPGPRRKNARQEQPPEKTAAPPPEEPAPITVLEAPSQDSIEVAEVDPMAEVAVYIEFGYFGQAAQTLRWYVDGAGSGNLDALRKLLQLYQKLGQIEDYADILERLCAADQDAGFVRQAILAGLAIDRDNLQLRVLSETRLKLGPEHLDRLLDPPQSAAPKPQAPMPPQKAETPPAKPTARPAPASPAQSTPSAPRTAQPLVDGNAPLAPLSAEEKAVLRIFGNPAHAARLHLAVRDLDAAAQSLRRAIDAQPKALANFTELLKIFHVRQQIDDYACTLWHLYTVLKDSGHALRERLLGIGFSLGDHPLLEALAQSKDGRQLEAIGRRFGLISEATPAPRKCLLVEAVHRHAPSLKIVGSNDALKEADAYLEFGQIEQALASLEAAVLKNPMDARLYPPLLDLYDRMDDPVRFTSLAANVKKLVQRPPEEVIPMMLALHQRFQLRKQKAA